MRRSCLVPASYVFLLRNGADGPEVLLHLRQGTGYMDGHWASLAGHVEAGETASEAAVREVDEEAAVQIDPADLEPLTTVHRVPPDGDPVEQRVDFFWAARRWRGTPRIVEPAKNAALDWFPLAALPSPVQPQEARVLALMRTALRCRRSSATEGSATAGSATAGSATAGSATAGACARPR